MNGVSLSTLLYFGYKALSSAIPVILGVLVVFGVVRLLRLFGFFQKGNSRKYDPKTTPQVQTTLKGKNLIFLGSSVTKGTGARNISFVDDLREAAGAVCTEEAVPGTTLANKGKGKSYVERMRSLDPKQPCDLFVVQLSTNDATFKVPVGDLCADGNYDETTVCGALETIFAYVKKVWNCPVILYTNPRYGSAHYAAMRLKALEAAEKWGVHVLDLWNDGNVTKDFSVRKAHYMNDSIHPTKKGYQYLTPLFIEAAQDCLAGKAPVYKAAELCPMEDIVKLEKRNRTKNIWKTIGMVLLAIWLGVSISSGIQLNNGLGIIKAGNAAKYDPINYPVLNDSPIKGKNILCVGSSVTQGYAAKNNSFVEYISHIDGANMIKEVYPATTVATQNENSYYPRLKHYTASDRIDAVIIQLSSNDSTFGSDLGEVKTEKETGNFDDSTFAGAMEAMIVYAKQTWDCPVIVYSDPYFRVKAFYSTENYDAMVQVTKAACAKWDAVFMNLWEDEEVNSIPLSKYKFYMSDVVHPTKAGYAEWWTPMFQKVLYEVLQ